MKLFLAVILFLCSFGVYAKGEILFHSEDLEGVRWIEAHVSGVDAVYGAEVEIYYPVKALQPVDLSDATAGPQLQGGDFFSEGAYEIANNIDVRTGRIRYGISLLKPAEAVSGDGKLFRLGFKTLTDKTASLDIQKIQFGTQQGQRVEVEFQQQLDIEPAYSVSTGKFSSGFTPKVGSKASQGNKSSAVMADILDNQLILILLTVIVLLLMAIVVLLLRRPKAQA